MSKQKLIIWPIFLLTLALTPAKAQITPDNTLGQEKSQITPFDAQSDIIEGGATRGSNLFHSFREFNIGEGRAAYFANPEIIQNIFSRVTGSNPSKIFGTLGVLGNANLFFLNPNGIIFGPNSSLDIRGSFTATTANSLIFPDSSRFNATNPNPAPILTIDVPVPLGIEFEGRQTGAIINTGFLATEQNLAFITGTVVNTGILFSPTNRISIATVNPEVKTILQIDAAGGILSQSTQPIKTPNPSGQTLAEIVTQTGEIAGLSVNEEGEVLLTTATSSTFLSEGDIAIVKFSFFAPSVKSQTIAIDSSNNILLLDASLDTPPPELVDLYPLIGILNASGTLSEEGVFLDNGGNINLIAKGDINAKADILAQGIVGGNISIISAGNFKLTNGAQINVRSSDKGSITISAQNVEMLEDTKVRAGIEAGVGSPEAQAGDIEVKATGTIALDADSRITNVVNSNGVGNAGDINLTSESLLLTNGASLSNAVFDNAKGNAGNINIEVSNNVELMAASNVFNQVFEEAEGNGGEINITASSLSLSNNSRLESAIFGKGNMGNINIDVSNNVELVASDIFNRVAPGAEGNSGGINITANSLLLSKSASLSTSIFGIGNAGNININAKDSVSFDASDTFSRVLEEAQGSSGEINITTGSLFLTNNSVLNSSIQGGKGDAKNININARARVSFDNQSIASTSVVSGATGKSGEINITTDSLFLNNSSSLLSALEGNGEAGKININASDTVSFDNQSLAAIAVVSEAIGKGGEINIITGSLFLTNNSGLNSNVQGDADAGKININARERVSFENGSIATSSISLGGKGKGGEINITTGSLVVNNSSLGSTTEGNGDAGNIFLNVTGDIELINGLISTEVLTSGIGKGGDIDIQSGSLKVDSGSISTATVRNDGGDITLNLDQDLTLRNGSNISTSAGSEQEGGDGGNIDLQAKFIVANLLENSNILANAFTGRGGNINITTEGIFGLIVSEEVTDFSDINASSQFGLDGNININNIGIDPTKSLTNFPQLVATPQVSQSCEVSDGKPTAEFYDLGKGGTLISPDDLFSNDAFDNEGLIPLPSVSETNKLSLVQISVSNSGLVLWCQRKEVQNTEFQEFRSALRVSEALAEVQ